MPIHERNQVGQHVRQHVRALERVGDAPEAAAQKHERPHALGPKPIRFQDHLGAERMTDEHDRRIAERTAHAVGIGRMRRHVDALRIARRAAPTVAAVVKVRERKPLAELRPQVLPDEAVAGDAVAEERRELLRSGLAAHVERSAIGSRYVRLPKYYRLLLVAGAGSGRLRWPRLLLRRHRCR
jgi:hypothetical protein